MLPELRKDPNFSKIIYKLITTFAYANHHSTDLWKVLTIETLKMLYSFESGSIANICWAFEKMKVEDKALWFELEKISINYLKELSISDKILIFYTFGKINLNFNDIWEIYINEFKDFELNQLKGVDFAHLILTLGKKKIKDEQLWKNIINNSNRIILTLKLKDFNNIIYGLLLAEIREEKLWKTCITYVKNLKFFAEQKRNLDERFFDEILLISHVFNQIEISDKEVWEKLGEIYLIFVNYPQFFIASNIKLDYHIGILMNNNNIINEKLEDLLLKKIISIKKKDNLIFCKHMIDCILVASQLQSHFSVKFFEALVQNLLEVNLNFSNEKIVTGWSRIFIILFEFFYKKDMLDVSDKLLLYFCENKKIELICKNRKAFAMIFNNIANFGGNAYFWGFSADFLQKTQILAENNLNTLWIVALIKHKMKFNYELHLDFNQKLLEFYNSLDFSKKKKFLSNVLELIRTEIIINEEELENLLAVNSFDGKKYLLLF